MRFEPAVFDSPNERLESVSLAHRQERDAGPLNCRVRLGRCARPGDSISPIASTNLSSGGGRTASQVKRCHIVERDAIAAEHDMKTGDVGPLRLRQFVDVAFEKVDVVVAIERDAEPVSSNRPISFMRPVRSNSLKEVDEPGTADAFRDAADDTDVESTVLIHADVFDGAVEPRHTARDGTTLECRAGGTGRGEDTVLVADDELRVGPDVHHRDEALFVGEPNREHAGRRIGADVAADDRKAVDAGRWMDGQETTPSGFDPAGRPRASSDISISVIDRVRVLPDRIHALPEEDVAHRRIGGDNDLVNRLRVDRKVLNRVREYPARVRRRSLLCARCRNGSAT